MFVRKPEGRRWYNYKDEVKQSKEMENGRRNSQEVGAGTGEHAMQHEISRPGCPHRLGKQTTSMCARCMLSAPLVPAGFTHWARPKDVRFDGSRICAAPSHSFCFKLKVLILFRCINLGALIMTKTRGVRMKRSSRAYLWPPAWGGCRHHSVPPSC